MKVLRAFVFISCGSLLAACATAPDVEFTPAEPPVEEEPMEEAPAVEIPDEEAPPEIETRAYPDTIVSSAEQLYGTNPGGQSQTYREALESNPNLGYVVIYFDFNKSDIKPEVREIIAEHAAFMREHPGAMVTVEGHADKRGTAGYNLALGERRAQAVKALLQAGGVDGSRIEVISYGEERPAVEGDGEEIYAKNRRAEIIYR